MREYDVTPQEQGTECIFQFDCQFYKYGIWCNICNQYKDWDDLEIDD